LKNKRIHEPLDKDKAMALITSALQKKEMSGQQANAQQPMQQNVSQSEDEQLPTPPPPPEHEEV